MKTASFLLSAVSTVIFTGCAWMHHVQLGQIDNRKSEAMVPFDIKVSENGVSAEEIGAIAKSFKTKGGDAAGDAAGIIALFQQGPRTGNPIYNEKYAERLIYQIHEKCPSGRVTGLMSVRETRKYPVISGEIVKVTGYCRKARKEAPADNEGDI
jgi:hypothetical protein